MDTIFNAKNANKYDCVLCDFKCSKLSNWNIHILTSKHIKRYKNDINDTKIMPNNATVYKCEKCNKHYNYHSGLWRHAKLCKSKNTLDETKIVEDKPLMSLVLEVVKSNTELQKQNDEFKSLIIEQNKSIIEQNNKMLETVKEVCKNNNTNITNNSNNVNSNNKAFNLQVFLNEECKDAMDINDFIDSVKLQLSDLELVGKLGFVDGISSIIIKNLKALKMNERPVHCTDMKRETMYVKEQGIWEKQEGDYKNLRKVIKRIAFKNSKNLSLYKELHPDYNDYYSKHSDHYLKLQIEAFGGSGNETIDNENKIIKKIAKEMTIDKSL
jgi:hypothetical protein